jgi:hypothetical protein
MPQLTSFCRYRTQEVAVSHLVMPLRLQKRLHSYGRVGSLENERLDYAAFSRVERTGIEPVTSGLQSRRSPS